MTRRDWLRRIVTGAAVVVAAPYVPLARLIAPPPQVGIAIRFVRAYSVVFEAPVRFDVIYGTSVVRPELAARVVG